MSYQLKGKVNVVQEPMTFASGFTKQELVVTVEDGKYPQDITVEFLQDKVSLLSGLEKGDAVDVSFDIRGREYNGRYFNNMVGWRIEVEGKVQVDSETGELVDEVPADANPAYFDDDIPF